jgi:Cu-processing system permease protein
MRQAIIIAGKEMRDSMRNRWVVATTALMAALALTLAFLGAAPTGTVKASGLAVTIVSLSSLTIFLVPLIALLLSHDAIVGEVDRGTMALLLAYPVARWQVVFGKFAGHLAILGFAIVVGYGAAALALQWAGNDENAPWTAFGVMVASSILLGGVFLAIGYFISTLVPRPRRGRRRRDRRMALLRVAVRHGSARLARGRPGTHGDGGPAERAAAPESHRRLPAAQPGRVD